MDDVMEKVFTLALGLTPPWRVVSVDFNKDLGELDMRLDFSRGARFACSQEGCSTIDCPVHDTQDKRWRHLDFFQHKAFLSARVPRVTCPDHGVHLVSVPWARPESGFTLLFEAALLTFARQMPISPLAHQARVQDTRIWRVIEHYVTVARAKLDFSGVRTLGVDETSARRGHDYVSIFMDLAEPRVMFATTGKDATTVKRFAKDLKEHGGKPKTQIEQVACDMSPAFISGVDTYLSSVSKNDEGEQVIEHQPEIVFDRYHVVAHLNEAVDLVRRDEAKSRPELAKTRYAWLKKPETLTKHQKEQLEWLTRPSLQLKTARAAKWRDDFNVFYTIPNAQRAETYLRNWCTGAKRSQLEPIKDFVRLVESHWYGIVSWAEYHINSGIVEGTNSLIQSAKRRARGYRNKAYMILIIYLIAGKLPLPQTHTI